MSNSATDGLCGCLRRIAALLEKGDPVEAALIVAEMNELFPGLPQEMPEAELVEAQSLLARCEALERDMRKDVLGSLQRLAATKKSSVYRRYDNSP